MAARTWTVVDSKVGPLSVAARDGAVVEVRFGDDTDGEAAVDPRTDHVLERAARELAEYFAGERTRFTVPVSLGGTPFQSEAWRVLSTIPFGETISYGAQASAMGRPTATRAVGAANGRNPVPVIVPCHRVIGKDGSLTGFASGIDIKAVLLEHEREVLARGGAR